MPEIQFEYHDSDYRADRHEYVDEIRAILERGLPAPETDWNTVWVISGPEEKFGDPGEKKGEINQTKNRFETGLNIAKMVAALRAHKELWDTELSDLTKFAPNIYFNGTDEQNDSIREMVSKGAFETEYNFPPKRILISPNLGIKHTGDQFTLYPKAHIPGEGKLVAVTDLYHIPRVRKCFKKYPIMPEERIILYPATPTTLPVQRALSEAKKIFQYIKRGIL